MGDMGRGGGGREGGKEGRGRGGVGRGYALRLAGPGSLGATGFCVCSANTALAAPVSPSAGSLWSTGAMLPFPLDAGAGGGFLPRGFENHGTRGGAGAGSLAHTPSPPASGPLHPLCPDSPTAPHSLHPRPHSAPAATKSTHPHPATPSRAGHRSSRGHPEQRTPLPHPAAPWRPHHPGHKVSCTQSTSTPRRTPPPALPRPRHGSPGSESLSVLPLEGARPPPGSAQSRPPAVRAAGRTVPTGSTPLPLFREAATPRARAT